ncbi:MAG: hypothetical protein LBH12_04205 [Dysgonamonadaceae bacterium]|jgi:glycosyltransferase involved in cell wall biosynthesis|nr:hypothetical protein [Dysgonamonadaceae bacterium]
MDIRIVIPCYNEPNIFSTIESLRNCEKDHFTVEIIVVVNSYIISSEEIKNLNRKTFHALQEYARLYDSPDFYLSPFLEENLSGHQTGAGLPRKIGMDKAAESFLNEKNNKGIIVSLDADTTVDKNYLVEIYHSFKKFKLKSATIEFHHPVEHLEKNDKIRQAVELYEEYLRYYRSALEYIGYPYAYYTIGSAFAVTAETYLQAGGMGKQQAGEDFYFLQKVFPLGKTKFIETTRVYPSARISDRVPFGTGPSISKMLEETEIKKWSYQIAAFSELKDFFRITETFYKLSKEEIMIRCSTFPSHLYRFLQKEGFFDKMVEINQHTSTPESFRKRFYGYFTAFKILKYLNFIHPDYYELTDVREQYRLLREIMK